MTIGERVKLRREELDMTQDELAQKLGYKSRSSINKIELGKNTISCRKIHDFAIALHTTSEYLLNGDLFFRSVGEKIKYLRKKLNLTLEELAVAAGSKKQNIWKYEVGIISNIPANKIKAIADKLQTTPAFLMGWEDASFFNEKDDINSDIILRLRSDADFLALVEKLNSLPADKLSAIRSLLT